MTDEELIRRGDALYAIAGWEIPSTAIAALPAVTVGVEQLRAAFDAGCENGWDHARWESVYDPQPLGCEDAFNKFLAALTTTPAPDAVGVSEAADRMEALVKERDGYKNICEQREEIIAARTDRYKVAEARAERLEAALREIESISVHSGGEVHGVTALQWELAFAQAQDVASSALSDVATASAALHRSFPEAGDGRPLPPMGDELMSAGLSAEDARFVAVQLAQNGYTLTKRED